MSLAGQKHPRDEVEQSEEVMLCLYELYSGDLSEHMLSFASIHDLCTFDALSKQFQSWAESRWKELVYKETGMKNGKIDWIRYLSFLQKPISVELVDEADHGYGCGFAGTPHVSTNGSLVVMVTDDTSDNAYDRTYPSNENEEICVRDAYSLNFSRLVSSPIYSWKSALCGRVGSEIIVTSNNREVAAIRGNDTQIVRRHRELVAPNGISLLGCDTHLIVCIGNCLKLYRVETDTASAELLSLKQSITIRESAQEIITGSVDDEISWGSDKSSFVYCRHGTEKISVWSLDVASDTINQVKLIDYGENEDLQIENVALGDDYIVGASTQRDIHVWNRFTGEKLPHVLCDIKEEDDRLGPDDIVRSLLLWCYGHILVSSSHLGNKLCIWDVKSGELLKEHVLELDELPDGSDPSSLAYLSHLNGFLLVTSYFSNFIAFPMNKRQEEMAKSIKRREQRIKRVLLFGIGEGFYPNNCSDSDDS